MGILCKGTPNRPTIQAFIRPSEVHSVEHIPKSSQVPYFGQSNADIYMGVFSGKGPRKVL